VGVSGTSGTRGSLVIRQYTRTMEVQARLKVQLFRKYLCYKTGINLAELLSNTMPHIQD